jgi:hypothetical protein
MLKSRKAIALATRGLRDIRLSENFEDSLLFVLYVGFLRDDDKSKKTLIPMMTN